MVISLSEVSFKKGLKTQKLPSKVAIRGSVVFRTANQPKTKPKYNFLFYKNCSLRDLCIMTLKIFPRAFSINLIWSTKLKYIYLICYIFIDWDIRFIMCSSHGFTNLFLEFFSRIFLRLHIFLYFFVK